MKQDRWDERLANWAQWRFGGGSVSTASMWDMVRSRRGELGCIVLVGEALDTDRLVGKLHHDAQTALKAWYWWTGTVADRASDLGIHRDTLADRVKAAKRKLAELDSARHARPIKTVLASPQYVL